MLNNKKNLHLKYGVSLVTVLLFMLVATIAATATYKLLTSGGLSSASRMKQQEAHQSALAGIENTRMWMTFHANDVGALVKAFIEGGNKPINIDARVRRWQSAKQDYHVWLTGVNTEKNTYKLKILSSGVSRIPGNENNGDVTVATWNESAIFNVDGLYRVRLLNEEVVEEVVASIPFKYNYFGGSTQSQGHIKAYSLLINGDLYGSNPAYTEDNLIVTGDVYITGNSVGAGGTACIGGDLFASNGVLGHDFYVGGDADHFSFPSTSEAAGLKNANVTGNVYIEGDLAASPTGDQKFQQNLTLNGTWSTNLSAHVAQVAGNLCLGPKGKVIISEKKPDPARSFKVGGNVWAESIWPIWLRNGQKNEAEYDRIIIGNKSDSKVYIKSAHPARDYVTLSENRTFVESKDYYRGTSGNAMGVGAQAKWDNKTTRVYKELPPHLKDNNNAYYLYYYGGPEKPEQTGQDVDFVVSSTGGFGFGFGGKTYYASYYVENQPFYTTGGFGIFAGNHLLNMEGNTPIGSPYCKATADKWRPECGVTPWFKSLGTVSNDLSGGRNFECADSVKAHCNKLWKKKKGCPHEIKSGNTDYLVEDILVTAYDKFVSYANKGCTEVTQWGNRMSELLNQCYRDNSSNPQKAKQNLYNGYQVVEVADPGQIRDPKTPLKGKFIIIVTNKMGQQKLPPTTSDSYVFLYLTQGTKTTPKNPGNTHLYTLQPASDNGTYNYFIYTKYDIDGLMFNNSVFSGSIYAAVGNPETTPSCAKAGDIKTRQMVFNEDLLNDLSANGVVCPASVGASCGGAVSSSSSAAEESSASADQSSGSGSTSSEYDSYYISMAPQLGVRLESQGKSKEPLPEAGGSNVTELAPSFIVLPRIIYLPSDPFGSLSDYYNIQPLNGSTLKKSDVSVTSCRGSGSASLPTSGKLYMSGDNLTPGLYTCTADADDHPSVPFWVLVVENNTRNTKIVSFKEESQEMSTDDQKDVLLKVPPLTDNLVVNVYCPDVDNGAWSYVVGPNVTRSGSSCTINLSPSADTTWPKLATVKTMNAVEGSLLFQLLPGEGYIPGSPSSTELYIKSIMHLNRMDATVDDIKEYCKTASCPDGYATYWPDCDVSGEWVAPSMTAINKIVNNSWAILISGSGNITLNSVGQNDCKVIIPQTADNSIAVNSVQANMTYYLRASAKAGVRQFTVGFSGNVGAGNNPVINVSTEKRGTVKQCEYNTAKNHSDTCSVSIFKGEDVTVELKDDDNAKEFSFWRCSGSSCPTTDESVTSKKYSSFTFSDDGTELIAVFGERDRHCFFDEFKRDSVGCDNIDTEYCIDKCGDDATSKCISADETGDFTNAKWHLISGILSQIITGPSGEIHIDKSVIKKKKQTAREPVVVMSTVNAGFAGTLKALINVPRATSSYDKSAVNIMKSGFMLRANKYGNDYFMLNLYENGNGELEAQLSNGSTSLSYVLTNGSETAHVSNSKMVMATIDLTTRDTLKVRANVGNFYGGAPTEYRGAFALSEFYSSLADAAHEYVGFSLADPNFKIYGIGWMSGTYNSECHDTYPTVKCSFAAVATDGVIKTEVDVVPWVGHSGWFDSKGCSPLYYYNGDDACSGGTCDVYKFSETGTGAHGYTVVNGETKTEVKTAKAWLGNCTNADEPDMAWGISAESARAHCGAFWTGKFEECKAHKPDLFSGSKPVNNGLEETVVFEDTHNFRAATLHITLENTDNNEVEIWLVSESDNWGESDHESHSVKMTGNTGSFDVMQEFATGSNGFDPEHVKQIVFKNHGSTSATLTSIASTCAKAIGITYCRADFDGDDWKVVTQVTNKDIADKLQVTATIDGGSGWTYEKSMKGIDNNAIAWNDDLALVWIRDEEVYTHAGKSYVINAKITAPGQEISKQCSVSPDPIGTIGVSCSVAGSVASGAKFPTFNIDFNGCPDVGCPYRVYLDYGKSGQELIVDDGLQKTSARHSADKTEVCNNTDGCEHTYTVMQRTDLKPFTACSATFKVLRKEEDAPPDVTCGISTSPNSFSTDPVFTGNQLYFVAYNEKSEDKTYNVTLKKGNDIVGTAILQSKSGRTNVASLGELAKGTHSYSLYVGDEKRCDASVTVNDASEACTISGTRYTGHKLSMTVSGVNANTQFKWTFNNSPKTIDCGTANCWNNEIKAPTTPGTYSYTVTKGANTICTGSVDIEPILTCSATPNPVGKGFPYTFTANAAVRCTNCSFTNDAGSTENNIVIPAGGSWTKNRTSNSLGPKQLALSCNSCNTDFNGDVNASCSVPLDVIKVKPTFSCADILKATVNRDNNVRIRLEDITSCDDDDKCSYTISGTGSDATVYTGCTNTNCTIPAITNKSKNKGDTAIYTVTLTNNAGSTTENCSVDFVEGPTITCSCVSVCGEGCQTRIKTTSLNNTAFTGCMFFKDISTLQFNSYTLNGVDRTGRFCWDNATDCATKLSAITKIDGGYYVKVENQTGYMIVTGTPAEDPCAGSGADNPVQETVIITVGKDIQNYYSPSQEQEYENGTCFSLVGTWDDCCYHPTPALNCQNVSGNGMTYSYNGNDAYKTTDNGNMKENFGVTLQQTTTTTTFIDNVCVTSKSGSKIRCKFEN